MAQKIGTKIIVHRHRAGAASTTVAVSAELPQNSVITQLQFSSNALGGDSSTAFFDLYLSEDAGTTSSPVTGSKLTDHTLAGVVNPDVTGDAAEALPAFHSTSEVYGLPLDVWIPITKPGMRLKTVLHQLSATASVNVVTAVCTIFDSAVYDATAGVIPRGTPDSPLCVNVCNFPPPIEQPPITPPPGPTPPTTAAGPDVLADPLPLACEVSVDAPLSSASSTCQRTAG